jgi:hypothetical protein
MIPLYRCKYHIEKSQLHSKRNKEQIHMEWLLDQTEAIVHAIADTQAAFSAGSEILDPLVLITRLSDLTRSYSFLSVEASLKALEHSEIVAGVSTQHSRARSLDRVYGTEWKRKVVASPGSTARLEIAASAQCESLT